MASDSDNAGLRRVMELAVASLRAGKRPAVLLDFPDDFADLHIENVTLSIQADKGYLHREAVLILRCCLSAIGERAPLNYLQQC